ncbi:hypothetical protein NM688_g839 [Phlebia brevispora]|uniref:Uncharacterized protein n=1 Tax=Phlebia brevispora TaxID=194682 RepID=A0ACC1TCV7_9APHY|nr:hypothetical protein NM688_g839 [Phlebia brevispora]
MAYPPGSDFSHLPPTSPLLACSSSESSADLSSSELDYTPSQRDLSLPPAAYQHYSNLRTTNKPQSPVEPKLVVRAASHFPHCCCEMDALHIAPSSPTCDECVQECEEGDCDVQLTEQCTDQCVVVPCHDTHHGLAPCDPTSSDICDFTCVDGTGCGALDNFVGRSHSLLGHSLNSSPQIDCCTDYRHFFTDMRPPHEQSNTFGWPPMADNAFQGYPTQPTGNSSFYSTSSSASTPQLVPSPASFVSSPQPPSTVPAAVSQQFSAVHHDPHGSAASLPCMWGNCTASFSSLNELVGHVNLEHLRLPATPASAAQLSQSPIDTTPQMRTQHQRVDNSNPLSCLWADCQLYGTPNSIPGPSSGQQTDNVLGLLANHLLQDHLGLAMRAPSAGGTPIPHDAVNLVQPHHSISTSSESDTVSKPSPASGPLTPAPEHDCSEPHAHVCHWTGCGQSFASCDALTAHITSMHVGGGKAHYDCYWDDCPRHGDSGFASKQKICRHLQSHTGHRPFQCKICQQNFSEAATLAQHMRRHTQEKPYVCDFPGCGKSFAITGALTIHKRTHNGHKPFKCTYCERAFAESSNLSKHLRTHTGARPYPCIEPGCTKSFARPDQLARHMIVHRKKDAKPTEIVIPVAS